MSDWQKLATPADIDSLEASYLEQRAQMRAAIHRLCVSTGQHNAVDQTFDQVEAEQRLAFDALRLQFGELQTTRRELDNGGRQATLH